MEATHSAAVGTQSPGGWRKLRPQESPELVEMVLGPPTRVRDINQSEINLKGHPKAKGLK